MRNPPKPCLTQPSRMTPLKPELADNATNFFVANRIGGGDFSAVPRKPTLLARKAKSALADLIGQLPPESALPTVRELGARWDLHASTMSRMLREMENEGLVWQSPGGRYFPVAGRSHNLKGAPVCFIGREMWHWSRLYQDILKGVSEVCSANGSPLILLSAPSLVSQDDPTKPPHFASAATQKKELAALLPSVPRHCGAILVDHLWKDSALALSAFLPTPKAQLLHGSTKHMPVYAPDYHGTAKRVLRFVQSRDAKKILVVSPFQGDPAIDASVSLILQTLAHLDARKTSFDQARRRIRPGSAKKTEGKNLFICPEDNTAKALLDKMESIGNSPNKPLLLATQGTGLVHSPTSRLDIDFQKLGKSAASKLLHGSEVE